MDFKHLTPKSYLMNGLEEERDPKRGSAEEAARRNVIRKCIKSYFGGEKNIECFPMNRPVDDDSKLESLDVCKKADLKPEFVKSCEDLLINLKNKIKVKQINGRPLTGNMLLSLAMEYVDQINRGEVLSVVPSFEKVVDIESRVFSSKLFEVIRLRIQDQSKTESMPFEEQELQQMR